MTGNKVTFSVYLCVQKDSKTWVGGDTKYVMETLTIKTVDLLDLTDKNSSEWNLSSNESDTEEVATNQGNGCR